MVATSTKDAEIMAAYVAATETFWIRGLLSDIGAAEPGPSLMWTDSAAAKQQADGEVRHATNKHLLVKYHWTLEYETLEMRRLPSSRNISDVLTKSVPKESFRHYCALMLVYLTNDDIRGFPLNDAEAYLSEFAIKLAASSAMGSTIFSWYVEHSLLAHIHNICVCIYVRTLCGKMK